MDKADNSRTTTYVNHQQRKPPKKSNGWTPTYLDNDGRRWGELASCGWLAAAVYIELCHLGACWCEGWRGSIRKLGEALAWRVSGQHGSKASRAALGQAINRMAQAGILSIEQAGQSTIYRVVKPCGPNSSRPESEPPGGPEVGHPWTGSEPPPDRNQSTGGQKPGQERTGTSPPPFKDPELAEPSQNKTRTHTEQIGEEGGAGGNHPGPEPPFEAEHEPPVHTSECVSGAPPSTLMTPAGEEPVPDRQADDVCHDRHGETVDGPEPAPPFEGDSIDLGPPPPRKRILLPLGSPERSEHELAELDNDPAPPSDNVRTPPGVKPASAFGSRPALSDDDPPPPTDDDLPDYEDDLPGYEDDLPGYEDDLPASWPDYADAPEGHPDTVSVTADPSPTPEDSGQSLVGETPDSGEGSKGAIHSHYESEASDECDGSVPDIGGGHDRHRADDGVIDGGRNADVSAGDLSGGAPAGALGDSGRGGGGPMTTDSDVGAKAPELAPERPIPESQPEAHPEQLSLTGVSEGQELPSLKKPKPTTPREVTEALVEIYQETTGRKTRVLPKRVSMIGARMAEGFASADLDQALLGWWHCRFYQEDPGCKGVKAAGFIWPFTSADKVEKCMQRFVDEAPIDAVEAFTERTGRRIPEREAEIEQRRQAAEKLEEDKAYWRKRLSEERRVRREGALRELIPALKQAEQYEARLPGLEGKDADELRAYLSETWARIRAKADLKGVTRELEEQGLLPRDKGKEESNGQ